MPKSKGDRALRALLLVLFAALVFTIKDSFEERIVKAGDDAPGFSIKTDDGREISSNNFGGKVLVLNFWATWCPPCIDEIPSLNAFARQMREKGVVVLGISVDTNERAYSSFLKQVPLNFMTARDPESNISANYGTFKYPETYIIDRNGKVLQKHIGPQIWTDKALVDSIQGLL
jgi:peroxiredoxin